MAGDQTPVEDVKRDLAAIESASLRAARDYRRYLRDAEIAGLPEVAYFVCLLIEEDSARAAHCRGLLRTLGSPDIARRPPVPADQPSGMKAAASG
jgi:hypothetical protein